MHSLSMYMPGIVEPSLQGVEEPCRCLYLNGCFCIQKLHTVPERMHNNYSIRMCNKIQQAE